MAAIQLVRAGLLRTPTAAAAMAFSSDRAITRGGTP
jgi:hypothetical protein